MSLPGYLRSAPEPGLSGLDFARHDGAVDGAEAKALKREREETRDRSLEGRALSLPLGLRRTTRRSSLRTLGQSAEKSVVPIHFPPHFKRIQS